MSETAAVCVWHSGEGCLWKYRSVDLVDDISVDIGMKDIADDIGIDNDGMVDDTDIDEVTNAIVGTDGVAGITNVPTDEACPEKIGTEDGKRSRQCPEGATSHVCIEIGLLFLFCLVFVDSGKRELFLAPEKYNRLWAVFRIRIPY